MNDAHNASGVGISCATVDPVNTSAPTQCEQLEFGSVYPPVPVARESSRSVRAHIDDLIDWYERFNPAVRTVAANCCPSTLRKFCKKNGKRGGPWLYREREIIPMRKPRAEEE